MPSKSAGKRCAIISASRPPFDRMQQMPSALGRRRALTVLVKRLLPDARKANADLVDLLFALTGFEMFEALSVRNRSATSVEALLQDLVAQAVNRFRAAGPNSAGAS